MTYVKDEYSGGKEKLDPKRARRCEKCRKLDLPAKFQVGKLVIEDGVTRRTYECLDGCKSSTTHFITAAAPAGSPYYVGPVAEEPPRKRVRGHGVRDPKAFAKAAKQLGKKHKVKVPPLLPWLVEENKRRGQK